jgi:hypothetical protein
MMSCWRRGWNGRTHEARFKARSKRFLALGNGPLQATPYPGFDREEIRGHDQVPVLPGEIFAEGAECHCPQCDHRFGFLSAICKLAAEAAENASLDRSVAQGIVSLQGVRQSCNRAGNWLTREQARDLLAQPEIETTEGKRDRAILAVLLGCALRRSELAALESRHIQQRDGRWVFVDLVGKGKRILTVPIPPFVKVAIDDWTAAAGISKGPLFRRVRRRKYPEKTPEA